MNTFKIRAWFAFVAISAIFRKRGRGRGGDPDALFTQNTVCARQISKLALHINKLKLN